MNHYQSIFYQVINDPDYYFSIPWGKPRRGHPEGSVAAHIVHLEYNLEKMRELLPDLVRMSIWKFKILIHTHDTFKKDAIHGKGTADPHNHAHLARNFLARYCDDADLLNMVLYHDEGYNIWKQKQRGEEWETRFEKLLTTIKDWDIFMAFSIIDATTPGKEKFAITWFFDEVMKRKIVPNGESLRLFLKEQ